jgi:asparagine synthase (glutamine-hydrolysing)
MAHAATTALLFGRPDDGSLSPEWITPHSVVQHSESQRAQSRSLRLAGFPPGVRSNLDAIESLRRQIAYEVSASPVPRVERRYPYLDRDLWEFVCAIPREQILRPGQRRSLMRRSLAGIVPHEVLHRPRKAYVIRGPMNGIAVHWNEVKQLLFDMRCVDLGMVEAKLFEQALERARIGQPAAMVSIHRTIIVERWLRRVLDGSTPRRVVISPWVRVRLDPGIPRKTTLLEARMSCTDY